jgi:type I restriction enzyme, R subunit
MTRSSRGPSSRFSSAIRLSGEPREAWQPLLDLAIARYKALEEMEAQVTFKHQAKTFVRAYNFLAAVLPYGNPEWEQLSIYLTFLTPSLPSPEIDDLAKGLLQTVDGDVLDRRPGERSPRQA